MPAAASVEPAAAAAPNGGQQEQQQGFLGRIGGVLFKVMLFQTVMNFAASFFAPKPQHAVQQLPPLRNVLAPDADFDIFMHLHYVPSPAVPLPAGGQSEAGAAAAETPEVGLFDRARAKLGVLSQPPQAKGTLRLWGRVPLKKLLSPSSQQETYCPGAAATAAAAGAAGGGAAAEEQVAAAAPSVSEGDTRTPPAPCASPREFPRPVEAWKLLGQKYSYDWWSKSAERDVQFILDEEFVKNDDLLLVLTVTAVPFTAYDGNRYLMTPEEAVAAAAAIPVDRLIQQSQPMVQLMKPLTNKDEEHSLLVGTEEENEKRETEKNVQPIRHLKAQADVSLVYDTSAHTPSTLAAGPLQDLHLRLSAGEYEPMLDISDFWLIEKHFIPLNETLVGEPQTLHLSFGVGSVHAWLVQSQMAGVQQQQMQLGLQSDREAFMFKRILLETNPFMLAFSGVFIMCHSVFSFFAFKNDMQFWYKNESMEGLSAASLIFGFVCELVIGLYLFDSQETSWLILFEVFIGIAISAWKLTKAVRMQRQESFPFVTLSFTQSYSKSQTKDYDRTAITYASIALAPCLVGYAVYALFNNKYRSWYSYIISVLAGSVYTFGFVLMTPQLYINYKLKSVDHLPWRALIYRSLNTFVDDVASFLIDMPWMHRLSCFRDDIIFIVYLYQRWIYRVDKTRTVVPIEGEAQAAPAAEISDSGDASTTTTPPSANAVLEAAEAAVRAARKKETKNAPEQKEEVCSTTPPAEGLRRRQPAGAAAFSRSES